MRKMIGPMLLACSALVAAPTLIQGEEVLVLGNEVSGSTNYLWDGIAPSGRTLTADARSIASSVYDSTTGTAYFGSLTYPARIYRVDAASLRLLDVLTMPDAVNGFGSAAIDAERRAAYFATTLGRTTSAAVVKVDLDTGKVAGTLQTGPIGFDPRFSAALLDPSTGRLWLPTIVGGSSPTLSRFSLVDLDSFTWLPPLFPYGPSPQGQPYGALMDPTRRKIYYGDSQAGLVVLNMNDGFTTSLPIGAWATGFLDPQAGYGYFATSDGIKRVHLGEIVVDATIPTETFPRSCAVDRERGIAYFGGENGPLLAISISPFARIAAPGTNPVVEGLLTGVPGSDLLAATITDPASIVRMSDEGASITGGLELASRERLFTSAASNDVSGTVYLTTDAGTFVRLNSQTLETTQTQLLDSFAGTASCVLLDPPRRRALVGVSAAPGRLLTLDMETMERRSSLEVADAGVTSGAVSASGGTAWLGLAGANPGLVQVDLEQSRVVASLDLQSDELAGVVSVLLDEARGMVYVGTAGTQPRIVEVRLEGLVREKSILMDAQKGPARFVALDVEGGIGFFATGRAETNPLLTGPGAVLGVNLDTFSVTAQHNTAADLGGVVYDAPNRRLFYVTNQVPPSFNELNPVTLTATQGTIPLAFEDYPPRAMVYDARRGDVFVATYSRPGRVVRISTSLVGSLRALRAVAQETLLPTEVRFRSEAAGGRLRFSIYDDSEPKRLLWASGAVENQVAGGDVVVPIAAGTPTSLRLQPGVYWLAWETDSTAKVGSYRPGNSGEAFRLNRSFGPAPATISAAEVNTSNELWTYSLRGVRPTTNETEVSLFLLSLGGVPQADPNRDGIFDSSDLIALAQ